MEAKWFSVMDVMPEDMPELLWPDKYDDILNEEGKAKKRMHPETYPVLTINKEGLLCINERIWIENKEKALIGDGYYIWYRNTKPCAWMPIPKAEFVKTYKGL